MKDHDSADVCPEDPFWGRVDEEYAIWKDEQAANAVKEQPSMRTFTPNEEVYWQVPGGEWFKGIVREDRGHLLLVDRVVPPGGHKIMLVKYVNGLGLTELQPGSAADQIVGGE